MAQGHLDGITLSLLLDDQLPEPVRAKHMRHVERCPQCLQALEDLEKISLTLLQLDAVEPPQGFSALSKEILANLPPQDEPSDLLIEVKDYVMKPEDMPGFTATFDWKQWGSLVACAVLAFGLWQGISLEKDLSSASDLSSSGAGTFSVEEVIPRGFVEEDGGTTLGERGDSDLMMASPLPTYQDEFMETSAVPTDPWDVEDILTMEQRAELYILVEASSHVPFYVVVQEDFSHLAGISGDAWGVEELAPTLRYVLVEADQVPELEVSHLGLEQEYSGWFLLVQPEVG